MVKTLLIVYDLKIPGKEYELLYEAIKSFPKRRHYLESTRIIKTEESADTVWKKLKNFLDINDHILIIEVNKNEKQGWLPKESREWINNN